MLGKSVTLFFMSAINNRWRMLLEILTSNIYLKLVLLSFFSSEERDDSVYIVDVDSFKTLGDIVNRPVLVPCIF